MTTSDRIFDNSHCAIVTHVNEHRFASDVGHLSAIYQNLSASEKNRAKIVQCELGIRRITAGVLSLSHARVFLSRAHARISLSFCLSRYSV